MNRNETETKNSYCAREKTLVIGEWRIRAGTEIVFLLGPMGRTETNACQRRAMSGQNRWNAKNNHVLRKYDENLDLDLCTPILKLLAVHLTHDLLNHVRIARLLPVRVVVFTPGRISPVFSLRTPQRKTACKHRGSNVETTPRRVLLARRAFICVLHHTKPTPRNSHRQRRSSNIHWRITSQKTHTPKFSPTTPKV